MFLIFRRGISNEKLLIQKADIFYNSLQNGKRNQGESIKVRLQSSRRNPPRLHLYSENELNKCIECENPLREKYRTKEREIRRIGREDIIIEHISICDNYSCSKFHQEVYPVRQTPPKSSYHFEVIYEVGRLRRRENMTFQQIIFELKKQKVKVGNHPSSARHLYQLYEIYEMMWAEQDRQSEDNNRDVVLAMDGAKPENGVSTLYLITDVLNQDVLESEWLLYSGTDDITKLLQRIEGLNLNIKGFVSDKQRALLLGVQKVFGEIPHQYCQFHWLREAGRPLSEFDRRLNKHLKKNLRPIRDITRATAKSVENGRLPPQNLSFMIEIEEFLSVILKAKNKPPFVLQGIRNWQRAKMLLDEILNFLSKAKIDVLEGETRNLPLSHKSMILTARCLLKTLKSSSTDMWNASTALKWLLKIKDILNPESKSIEMVEGIRPSTIAKNEFNQLISQFDTLNTHFLESFRDHIKGMYKRWCDGLFTCFDYPNIPRTNNSLENLIYRIKKQYTKTTGRRNNHSILRHQHCFRYMVNFPKTDQFLRFCSNVSIKLYENYRSRFYQLLAPLIKENRIKRDFSGMLKQSFASISQEMVLSSVCT